MILLFEVNLSLNKSVLCYNTNYVKSGSTNLPFPYLLLNNSKVLVVSEF